MGSYIVQPGDTLSVISVKIYGTSSRWMELAHLNRLGNGSVIFPNELILYVPDKAAAAP
jgi:nucleoid-associated protein YgaU